ncbi:uncharacterized protein E0L32_003223 [Thyridium curvatum]|uniref:3-hydroxyisobutyrate dehydrogenase n=1 Tax=Thyridium curvatum TaxID=1093900 RepID=A0A507B1W6_9PEZI|nr:uncharacterized protein E0L32_003223 [Thyridium curvatum]TPX17105.1 hypothetical protein E0L32_003223 [Thyridium curvatum]
MAQNTKPEIAFIGLGAMGFGMATNLVKQGYPVTGFDIWGPTLDKFRVAGGATATTPAAAVKDKDHCVCMVATAQQAQAVLLDGPDPAVPAMPQNSTLLLCSTVPCAYVQSLEKQLAERGRGDILLIDCPVSGGAGRAADGTLSIMVGGSDAAVAKGRFLLQEMSDASKLYIVAGGIGAGSNMKMCHQVLAAVQILGASEGMGFASRLGLDPRAAGERCLQSKARSWFLEHRLPRMLHPEFQPVASALTIILKDTSIITSEARRYGFPTPLTSTAEQAYFSAVGRGWGADDDASLIRLYTEGAGKVGQVAGLAETEEAKTSLVVNLLRGINLCSATEALSFAKRVGLDLDQVLDLCVNAAGGSTMLQELGPDLVKALQGDAGAPNGGLKLQEIATGLQEAVEEAQRLKIPVYLGSAALNLISIGVLHNPAKADDITATSIARLWTP